MIERSGPAAVTARLLGGNPIDMRRACVSDSWIDPGDLEGDALTRWYLRSPAEIDQKRQSAAARRYQNFFYGPPDADPDPGFDRGTPAPEQDEDPGFDMPPPATSQGVDPGFSWVRAGPSGSEQVAECEDRRPSTSILGRAHVRQQDGSAGWRHGWACTRSG